MIEVVAIFALLTAVFEIVVLEKMSVKARIYALSYPNLITAVMCAFNLWIHWGTIVGSMTAVTAGLASMGATGWMRKRWGFIYKCEGREVFKRGQKYIDVHELGW